MHLRPAQGDALIILGHDADVIIGMRLIARAFAPVSFHVGLGDGDGQVALPAVIVEFLDAGEVVRAHVLVHVGGQQTQGEERVGAYLLDQDDEVPPKAVARSIRALRFKRSSAFSGTW